MTLFNRKQSRKLSQTEKQRKARLQRTIKPSTQLTIRYTSQFEDGLMYITGQEYSKSFRLGDVAYTSTTDEEKIDVITTYAEAINSLDAGDNFQFLGINRRIETQVVADVLFDNVGDEYQNYRDEYNAIINKRFSKNSKNFQFDKYIIISTDANDSDLADRQLDEMGVSLANQFAEMEISLTDMDGLDRLKIFNYLLKGENFLTYNYRDIALSGLTSKDFIAPSRIKFMEDRMKIDHFYAKVMYIGKYPTFLSDRLMKKLTETGVEFAITVHAKPYDTSDALKKINSQQAAVKSEMIKNQKDGLRDGIIDSELSTSGVAKEVNEATKEWKDEIIDNDQKMYAGLIAVYFIAPDNETLNANADKLKTAARRLGVDFNDCYYYQEEALNTILPIGHAYLDVKKRFVRDMTTDNVATQIPFTNVELISNSKKALYYGQNQLSNNIITLDRKADLNTGSGMIFGTAGAGKGMTVKTAEIIPTLLRYPEDRIIIIDPEDEYTTIGREFNAQIIDIAVGSKNHLNLLDLPSQDKLDLLDDEDNDPIGDKANLLMGLFESMFDEVSDEEFGIIDRVTALTYERFEGSGKLPTLADWHNVLLEQPEEFAQNLATKSEPYAKGSQNIFSYQSNVNLDSRFIIFNIKRLKGKLKPFALLVIQDYIWNMIVENQGKLTTRLYVDEIQLLFKDQAQRTFFTELYSRVRKYGAIPTGITQNIETVLSTEEGRKLLSNSEFMILLRQKETDMMQLRKILKLSPTLERYILKPKTKGSGLIVAGDVIVPFNNTIPDNTRLFQLTHTNAKN
ncbi:VirB4-like conjugal transfer ATPase, CD1110 family [Streptococcus ovis]|uniref:VirB4-like conjugal transfer ATPase, CD1110 family n=1 Tax=Streptococcus ovis TaxID=82806 RepID=UPI0003698EAD|nr:DUF87 domain-containing protein [Streptococcus ovis]